MRFPRKREWAALVLLSRRLGEGNLGEALDILASEMCVTKRTARNIVKRLKRLGLADIIAVGEEIRIRVADPLEALERLTTAYIEGRRARCPLSRRKRQMPSRGAG